MDKLSVHKVRQAVFILLILFLPIFKLSSDKFDIYCIRTPQYWLWGSVILFFIILGFKNVFIKIFLSWALFSTFLHSSSDAYFLLFCFILIAYSIEFVQKMNTNYIKYAILGASYLIYYAYFIRGYKDEWIAGAFLSFAIPLILSLSQPFLINIFLSIIPLLGVLQTKSTMAILAAFVGIGIFFLLTKRYKILTGFILIISVSVLIINKNPKSKLFYDSFRPMVWEKALKKVKFTWTGTGLRTFKDYEIMEGQKTKAFHAHNEFLEIYCEMGALGLIILLVFIFDLFCVKCPVEYKAMGLAIITHCAGYYPAHLACTGLLMIICVGIIEKYKEVKE